MLFVPRRWGTLRRIRRSQWARSCCRFGHRSRHVTGTYRRPFAHDQQWSTQPLTSTNVGRSDCPIT